MSVQYIVQYSIESNFFTWENRVRVQFLSNFQLTSFLNKELS